MTNNPIMRSLMAAGFSAAVLAGCAKAEIPFLHASQAPLGELPPAASARAPAASAAVAVPGFSSLVEKYGPAARPHRLAVRRDKPRRPSSTFREG